MTASDLQDACNQYDNDIIETQTADKLETEHRKDNLILLAYVILLILSVLTVWAFKHRRVKYIHSSGLAIIYGLIAGSIIRFGLNPEVYSSATYNLKAPSSKFSCNELIPPQKMVLRINVSDIFPKNATEDRLLYYLYSFERSTKSLNISDNTADFRPEIFFNILLPPIIFTAGYSMKKRHFFRNIGAICTYAFMGTAIAAFSIASFCFGLTRMIPAISSKLSFVDCVLFGSMISATDPVTVLAIFNELNVDSDLYALVFGESIFNDAVAIALTHAVENYNKIGSLGISAVMPTIGSFCTMFTGSLAIGVFTGLITSLLTKFTDIKAHPLLETSLFVLMSYSTFLLAEGIGYTGIVSVLFCGIIQGHYTYNNLSKPSKVWTKDFFELLNFLSENFIFAYLGVATFTFRDHYWRIDFIFIAILGCVLARAIQIYSLSFLVNGIRHLQAYGCRKAPLTTATQPRFSPERSPKEMGTYSQWVDETSFHDKPETVDFPENNVCIPLSHQHMLLFAGLRGAMAFSLAARNASTYMRQMFFSTTLVIVMISVLICGSLVSPVMQWLKIRVGFEQSSEDDSDYDPAAIATKRTEQERHYRERNGCWRMWSSFDSRYLKPFLTNSVPTLVDTLPGCCKRIGLLLTTEEQRQLAETAMHHDLEHRDIENAGYSNEESMVSSTTISNPRQERESSLLLDDLTLYHINDQQVLVNVRKATFQNQNPSS
ncbi:Sodium hydrogen exchanger [Cichlidogyrus casuarinus]|uniref:Sodium/hydrogen exchanger n=1 Tax=Cichlidogyrus casuarinus TaxID=1844966 RepID=A0ABD2PVA3_9PLAT